MKVDLWTSDLVTNVLENSLKEPYLGTCVNYELSLHWQLASLILSREITFPAQGTSFEEMPWEGSPGNWQTFFNGSFRLKGRKCEILWGGGGGGRHCARPPASCNSSQIRES